MRVFTLHASMFTYTLTRKCIQEPTCLLTSYNTAQTFAIRCALAEPSVLFSCTWYACVSVYQNMHTHANVYVYIYICFCAKWIFFTAYVFWCMQGPSCSPPLLGIHVYLCVRTWTHTHMCQNMNTHIHVYVYTHTHECIHISYAWRALRALLLYLVYFHICTYTHVRTHMWIYVHIYKLIYMYMCMLAQWGLFVLSSCMW